MTFRLMIIGALLMLLSMAIPFASQGAVNLIIMAAIFLCGLGFVLAAPMENKTKPGKEKYRAYGFGEGGLEEL